MAGINRVTITGRLTRDPEIRTTTTGKQMASFSVAVDRRFKSQDPNEKSADFFRCTAWEKNAEFLANYAHKGRMVGVDGRLQQRKYTNKDGVEVEVLEIIAENVALLDRPREDGGAPREAGEHAAVTVGGGADISPDEYDPFAEE